MRYAWKLPRVLLAAVLFFAALIATADVAVPPLQGRVTDLTSTLDTGQRAALETKLAAFEQRKGSQIAVLLVPTTQPETIEQYGIRVAEQWKLGRKGIDDGALLLIAKNDRALRIEVGRGLEGVLPDAIAKRIIAEDITPLFRSGDFNAGIHAGVDRMIKVVDGEPLPPPRAVNRGASSEFQFNDVLVWGGLLAVFIGGILRRLFGKFFGSVLTGGLAAGAAIFLGATVAIGAIAGVVVFVISLMGISFIGGGGSGGWSSGGGSWGGGGGGFGGGGASGRW
jgi:uncharacterized protein